MNIFLQRCTEKDVDILREISVKTYFETFEKFNSPENMRAYLDKAFGYDKLYRELSNPHSFFYILYGEGKPAGYLKTNEFPAQTDVHDEKSLEIERIYILKEHRGCGYGRYLLQQAVDFAVQRKKSYVWLGVWEHNAKALKFYKNNGFYKIGAHSFFMGDDEQTDYIMRKDIR